MGWNKYHAVKTIVSGRTFPSKLEAQVFSHHLLLEKAGEILELKQYDTVELTLARIKYKTDGKYLDKERNPHWIEAKGFIGDRFRVLKDLWKFYGPGPLHIWRLDRKRLLEEVVIPSSNPDEAD